MAVRDLSGTTAIVTGASKGFGRATAIALAGRGAHVVGVARSADLLNELRDHLGGAFTAEVADVTDPTLPRRLFSEYRPHTLVLNAGARPPIGPLPKQTWETFSTNWHVDVRQAFNFAKASLLAPLEPGSVVAIISSGAALRGSPVSGGYAGAKATVRFISAHAAAEAESRSLGVRFVAVLPMLTPATDLGRVGVETYAQRAGISVEGLSGATRSHSDDRTSRQDHCQRCHRRELLRRRLLVDRDGAQPSCVSSAARRFGSEVDLYSPSQYSGGRPSEPRNAGAPNIPPGGDMNSLLDSAVAAHGGMDTWNQVKSMSVGASITGAVWSVKNQGDTLKDVRFEVDTHGNG